MGREDHPLADQPLPAEAEPESNWFRQLKGDRLEVSLRWGGRKMRASGPEEEVWKLVSAFEDLIHAEIVGEWRRPPRTGSRPIAGQLAIDELQSDGNGEG